ncbi:cell shape determining protein MreC [Streptococcus pneumoniae]|nr:cell shape determining protein MreC [Streptococcus pneumoniae]
MKSKLQATKTLAADVIMRSPVSWKQELTLDAGRSKGASENMLAIANGGLIGSVSKVEENSTIVNLLTNTENADKISVKIQHGSTTIYGIIIGYDKENDVLKVSQLNSNSDISAGDKVTTGGLGNFNVADIPVGEVVATTHSTDYLTREVTVKLSADTHNVDVIELVGNS